jgi:hypothetical protein
MPRISGHRRPPIRDAPIPAIAQIAMMTTPYGENA